MLLLKVIYRADTCDIICVIHKIYTHSSQSQLITIKCYNEILYKMNVGHF